MTRPRVLIEDWLPAAAIGVECMRERGSASALAPHTFLHVWWARRPLTVSRAAVLASLLPAEFDRRTFERLLGFGKPSEEIVAIRRLMDTGTRVEGGFGYDRAFTRLIFEADLGRAREGFSELWGSNPRVIDPMAGGGSIPLEAARLGLETLANEYNPVACSILEATVDAPIRHGEELGSVARTWAAEWLKRIEKRLAPFFPKQDLSKVHAYIFARTVPCPNAGHPTPLVPDWHLLKPKSGKRVIAVPQVNRERGTWTIAVRELGGGAGQLRTPPPPTYGHGKGISLFDGRQIPADYIKAKAQAGEMGFGLYAVARKDHRGLHFAPPGREDLAALAAAERELQRLRPRWEAENVIPTELYPEVTSDERPRTYGMPRWADLFTPRQLLVAGTLVEELRKLEPEIVAAEGQKLGRAVVHLLAFVVDKFLNYNNGMASWHAPRQVIRSIFDRHDYSFKPTFAEMAPCFAGSGLEWAIDNVLTAYEKLAKLPRAEDARPVRITLGSATSLPDLDDGTITAVVIDPPYDDNVQYSELADFFYVWLKRTIGHHHPGWFAGYLCDHSEEAVVNIARHREAGETGRKGAEARARAFYRELMHDTFAESRRILRDDGVLTVMFTHKKQEAWAALFASLIEAGFQITATWPVKTESEHSLHQAKKNAAQSTVLLVARKRLGGAGVGYFDRRMQADIETAAQSAAERLQGEGLNPVDQLVGAFGPAMEVFSAFDEVRTDTGQPVDVAHAITIAADAVSRWRVEQLARRGLEGVEPEGRFALLCWDVLGAAEFRFNEAKLLGHAVGMDVDRLVAAGLVAKKGDTIKILQARERRRDHALEPEEMEELLAAYEASASGGRRRRRASLQVHPNDASFRTALDGCHALALRYVEAGGGPAGVGAARALVRRQGWGEGSAVARLMEALVNAAPLALRQEKTPAGKAYPEFHAWHALLGPLFGLETPDWTAKPEAQPRLAFDGQAEDEV